MNSALWMFCAVGIYAWNDALLKVLLQTHSQEIVLTGRSLWTSLCFGIWYWLGKREFPRGRALTLQLFRSVFCAAGFFLSLRALEKLSLTAYTATFMTYPLMTALLSAMVFKEPFPMLLGISFGFVFGGMMLVLDYPLTVDENVGLVYGLSAAFCVAIGFLFTKVIQQRAHSKVVTQLFYGMTCLGLGVALSPQSPQLLMQEPLSMWGLLGLAAFFQAAAFGALLKGFEKGTLAVLMPIEYSCFIWAMIGDYLLWHRIPTGTTGVGCALILAGLIIPHYRLWGSKTLNHKGFKS